MKIEIDFGARLSEFLVLSNLIQWRSVMSNTIPNIGDINSQHNKQLNVSILSQNEIKTAKKIKWVEKKTRQNTK